MKNVLITTLGYTKNLIDTEFFHFVSPNGARTYCTGISVAEAGTKYILSNYHIDEIFVLGSHDSVNSPESVTSITLADWEPSSSSLTDAFSEYDFYCYRILQFLKNLDIEVKDVSDKLSDEERQDAVAKFRDFKKKNQISVKDKDLFNALDTDALQLDNVKKFRHSVSRAQWDWLRYMAFIRMDSFYKMHPLDANKDITVHFVPVEKNTNKPFELRDLATVIDSMLPESSDQTNCYLDLQGMAFCDAYSFFNIFSMIRRDTARHINLAGLIQSTASAECLSAPILDEWAQLELHELFTGINIFLNYGKADYVENYRDTHGLSTPNIDRMLIGMKYIEEGISLCNIPVLTYGISTLRKHFQQHPPADTKDQIAYSILGTTIQNDYGSLLESDKISIPELLKWALRKKLYQQALTILESCVPKDIVERGIFYYAQSQEDLDRMMEKLNILYWNEPPKTRYSFSDLEHYFVKFYGRGEIDHRQKKAAVNRDLTHLRIAELHGKTDLIPAYSNLNNDDMLYELLLNYYNIGQLRNEICHAMPPEHALDSGEELVPTSNLDVLDNAIRKFTEIYSAACKRVSKSNDLPVPIILEQARFKAYCSKHRLIPFEQIGEDTIDNTVVCNFNGNELTVNIRMLKPQDSFPDE